MLLISHSSLVHPTALIKVASLAGKMLGFMEMKEEEEDVEEEKEEEEEEQQKDEEMVYWARSTSLVRRRDREEVGVTRV